MSDIGLFSLDSDNVVTFSLKNIERIVHGPEEALQIVAYHIFTTPGRSLFNREEGGGMKSIIDGNIRSSDELNTDVAIIINKASQSILDSQSSDKPADATVTGLKLQSVASNGLKIEISLLINLLDGNSFQATFPVT